MTRTMRAAAHRHIQFLCFTFAFAFAIAAIASAARALTVDVTFNAAAFVGFTPVDPSGETPPQDSVSGTLRVETDDVAGPPGEVHDVFVAPSSASFEIAGVAYSPANIEVYLGFRDGQLIQLTAGGNAPNPEVDWPVSLTMLPGRDDFSLHMLFDEAGGFDLTQGSCSMQFAYTTASVPGDFGAGYLQLSVSLDGGPPLETVFTQTPPIEDALVCAKARGSPDPQGHLANSMVDAALGALLSISAGESVCAPPGDRAARSAPAGAVLREVRIAHAGAVRARRAAAQPQTFTTALGPVTLLVADPDRLLLPAAQDARPPQPPADAGSLRLRCSKARSAPGSAATRRVQNAVLVDGQGHAHSYGLRRPTRLCVGPDGAGGDPSQVLICFRARPDDRSERKLEARGSDAWVAHELGLERLDLLGTTEVCLHPEGPRR